MKARLVRKTDDRRFDFIREDRSPDLRAVAADPGKRLFRSFRRSQGGDAWRSRPADAGGAGEDPRLRGDLSHRAGRQGIPVAAAEARDGGELWRRLRPYR